MASVQMECPICHRRMKYGRHKCLCGQDMDAAKKWKRTKDQKKAVRYWVKAIIKGKSVRLNPADYDGLDPFSHKDAKTLQARFTTAKHENRIEIFDKKVESTWTVQQLCDWHLEQESTKSQRQYAGKRSNLKYLCAEIGHLRLSEVTPGVLNNLRAKVVKNGKSDGTVNNYFTALSAAATAAVKEKKISADIRVNFREADIVKAAPKPRVLTVDEFGAIHRNAKPYLQPVLMTGYWTGCRVEEVLSLRWNQIDWKGKTITFPVLKKKKVGVTKTIPIASPLWQVLSKLHNVIHRQDDFVFTSVMGKRVTEPDDDIKTAAEKAGLVYGRGRVNGVTFKAFRSTMEHDLRMAEVHLHEANEILGHGDGSMARWYDQVPVEELRGAINKLERSRENGAHHGAQVGKGDKVIA